MTKKILLLGETCLDRFIYGNCDRLNPEAPTPVFTPKNEVDNFGMAANVRCNIEHLGLDLDMITNEEELIKIRFVDSTSNYILLRVDEEDELSPLSLDTLNVDNLKGYDAVVVSDYDKGLLTKKYLDRLFMFCKAIGVPTFMDTKKIIGSWAIDCSFIKINKKEFKNEGHNELLSSIMFKESIIVTLGHEGSYWNGKTTPTNEVSVRDVVGAGDTYLAGLVYGYLENNEIENGIMVANRLASDVVTKKGVALPNKELI